MSSVERTFACLLLTLPATACQTAAEVFHVPPPEGCLSPREIRYCLTTWNRDSRNVNARAAVGEAAAAWNRVGPYHLREVSCDTPHELTISFEHGVHADGHEPAPWPEHMIAHATFPNEPVLFIHFNDDRAWWQARDTPNQGYDMRSVAMHEIGHVLGLQHDDGGDSIMTPYRVHSTPLGSDIERVQSYARRCNVDPPPPVEITAPAPGATWRRGTTRSVTWSAPSLGGHVELGVYRHGELLSILWEEAPASGQLPVLVRSNWPLGAGYEICINHPEAGQFCSTMVLVTP